MKSLTAALAAATLTQVSLTRILNPDVGGPQRWLQWSGWSECRGICGNAIKTAGRRCVNGVEGEGLCTGSAVKRMKCSDAESQSSSLVLALDDCAYWRYWGEWGHCVPNHMDCCDQVHRGLRERTRTCEDPAFKLTGHSDRCLGDSEEHKDCEVSKNIPCPPDVCEEVKDHTHICRTEDTYRTICTDHCTGKKYEKNIRRVPVLECTDEMREICPKVFDGWYHIDHDTHVPTIITSRDSVCERDPCITHTITGTTSYTTFDGQPLTICGVIPHEKEFPCIDRNSHEYCHHEHEFHWSHCEVDIDVCHWDNHLNHWTHQQTATFQTGTCTHMCYDKHCSHGKCPEWTREFDIFQIKTRKRECPKVTCEDHVSDIQIQCATSVPHTEGEHCHQCTQTFTCSCDNNEINIPKTLSVECPLELIRTCQPPVPSKRLIGGLVPEVCGCSDEHKSQKFLQCNHHGVTVLSHDLEDCPALTSRTEYGHWHNSHYLEKLILRGECICEYERENGAHELRTVHSVTFAETLQVCHTYDLQNEIRRSEHALFDFECAVTKRTEVPEAPVCFHPGQHVPICETYSWSTCHSRKVGVPNTYPCWPEPPPCCTYTSRIVEEDCQTFHCPADSRGQLAARTRVWTLDPWANENGVDTRNCERKADESLEPIQCPLAACPGWKEFSAWSSCR